MSTVGGIMFAAVIAASCLQVFRLDFQRGLKLRSRLCIIRGLLGIVLSPFPLLGFFVIVQFMPKYHEPVHQTVRQSYRLKPTKPARPLGFAKMAAGTFTVGQPYR